MRNATIQVTLSRAEWRLISTWREIQPSPLKARVGRLLDELIAFVQEPRCAEMQADGVPCDSVETQCDQCLHVTEMLDKMDRLTRLKQRGPAVLSASATAFPR
jgi:hypothetical protein